MFSKIPQSLWLGSCFLLSRANVHVNIQFECSEKNNRFEIKIRILFIFKWVKKRERQNRINRNESFNGRFSFRLSNLFECLKPFHPYLSAISKAENIWRQKSEEQDGEWEEKKEATHRIDFYESIWIDLVIR